MERRNLTIYVNNDELAQIEVIRKRHLRRTYADTLRFLIAQEAEKILSNNNPIGLIQQPPPQPQPQPSSSPAPAARHVPTVEELVADYRADGHMMPTYWRHLTEEERDRVASECHFSESELEFLEETLEENR